MLAPGVYPASVTPFDSSGKLDPLSLARMLAWFEASGCRGVVLAGTNGEGPSLSAPEKRDLVVAARLAAGSLTLILGVATPSLTEAQWLAKQAAREGCEALLVMPPAYWRNVSEEATARWFLALMDSSPIPIVAYNHPAMTGIPLTPPLIRSLSRHENFEGIKDSSGSSANLAPYREAVPFGKQLFVGDETLLHEALLAGWTGSISGAANVLAPHLVALFHDHAGGTTDSALERHRVLLPALEAIRRAPQPATHKAILGQIGRLTDAMLRVPLEPSPDSGRAVREVIESALGPITA